MHKWPIGEIQGGWEGMRRIEKEELEGSRAKSRISSSRNDNDYFFLKLYICWSKLDLCCFYSFNSQTTI